MAELSGTVTIAGGKGGVGKTTVALNLALVLAQQGHRTLLLDGDLELANVNIMLGLYPTATLEQAVAGEVALEDVLVPVQDKLDLLPGASGVQNCLDQPHARRQAFLRELATLESGYERVVIDTAAGLSTSALHMIAAAQLTLLVITPDPTSLTDAFSLLKLLYRRGYRRQPDVLVNMAANATQARSIYQRFASAVHHHIGLNCRDLGFVPRDGAIASAVRHQQPVAMLGPANPSSQPFHALTGKVSTCWSEKSTRSLGFARYWLRLLQRKARQETAPKAVAGSKPDAPASTRPGLSEQWSAQFRDWLRAPDVTAVQRYEAVNTWLGVLGDSLDEDMIEALQTGLANMRWDQLPDSQRRAAAAHFRQLAELITPPPAPELPSSGQSPRYAADLYGSQDRLLNQLRQQPRGQSISRLLEQLRTPGEA